MLTRLVIKFENTNKFMADYMMSLSVEPEDGKTRYEIYYPFIFFHVYLDKEELDFLILKGAHVHQYE